MMKRSMEEIKKFARKILTEYFCKYRYAEDQIQKIKLETWKVDIIFEDKQFFTVGVGR